jgi:recombination protein RecA
MAKKKKDKINPTSVDEVMEIVNKQYGDGSLQYGDTTVVVPCESISTGAITLDIALGVGGVPRGRIVELYGPESSGKTTLALHIAAEAQKAGGRAAFIDAEHALDKYWAKNLGIDIKELVLSQPDSGEQALEICELLVRSKQFDIIIIDSVAALTPQCEIDGELGDSHIGAQARLISKAMRGLCGLVHTSDTCVIFINQIREKIGVMFGSPEVTPGGRALKFYSTMRIDVRRIGAIKDGENSIGQEVRAKVVKNKVAPPHEFAKYKIYFGKAAHRVYGIDYYDALLLQAAEVDIVRKAGAWFSFGDIRLGQGASASSMFLKDNKNVAQEIEQLVRDRFKSTQVEPNINPSADEDETVDETGFDESEENDG